MLDFNNAPKQDEVHHAHRINADDIRHRLNLIADSFVRSLYGGRALIRKGQARIGNVQGQAGDSLAIELGGASAGLWHDHATGESGDLIELYRAYMGYPPNVDFHLSLKELASEFLGDAIEVERPPWRMPKARIEEDKKRYGTTPPKEAQEPLGAPVAEYAYYNEQGVLIAKVHRYEPKTFRPFHNKIEKDGSSKWGMGMPKVRPLYRLPQVAAANEVVLVEGEGKADLLAARGVVTTSVMGGANADGDTNWFPLAQKTVCIWPDNDEAGRNFAKRVTEKLIALGSKVWLVPIPHGKAEHWDVKDLIEEGGDPLELLNAAEEVVPGAVPLILSASEFVAGFTSPKYLIKGMIQRSYLYSLTARTGHGKTAVILHAGQCVAQGKPFHGRKTVQGSVLYLAGENSDDIRARFLVLADYEDFDPDTIPMYFIDGVIDIEASLPRIHIEAARIPNLILVIVDTAAAYFRGDEDNSNTQKMRYARVLRELIKLPGKPAVVVNCHPVKNASPDNLIPMGGSAFLNEVDGNLTLWAEGGEKVTSLHWMGKFRGPEFEAMDFDLKTTTSDRVKDDDGVRMPGVVAVPITEAGAESRVKRMESDEDAILRLMHENKNASFTKLAELAGFVLPDGQPAKAKVQRIIDRLKEDGFISKYRKSKYRLTKKGLKAVGIKSGNGDEDD